MKSEKEIWRKIHGFEEYDVSTFGNVRSWKYNSPRLLKWQFTNKKRNRIVVTLCRKNTIKQFLVSRLVAKTFINNKDKKKDIVNHIDGDPTNNNIKNLEWCTQKENIKKYLIKTHNSKKCGICRDYRNHMKGKN